MKITRRQLRRIIKEELNYAVQQNLITESAEMLLAELGQVIKQVALRGEAVLVTTDYMGLFEKLRKMHPQQIAKMPGVITAAIAAAKAEATPRIAARLTSRWVASVIASAMAEMSTVGTAVSSAAAGLTAGSTIAAGATFAAVFALFGGLAFATFYPIAQMKKIENLITKMAQLNGRPIQLRDLESPAQKRLKDYLANVILAMNDRKNPSSEARASFSKLMDPTLKPAKSSARGDIPAHSAIDYKTVESLKPYIRELQKKGKEEATNMKEEPGVA